MLSIRRWRYIRLLAFVAISLIMLLYTNMQHIIGRPSLQNECPVHTLDAETVAVSNNGELLLSVWTTGNARLWDVKSGKLLQSFHIEDDPEISSVTISEDNNYVLLATNNLAPKGKVKKDVHITQWNVADGSLERTLDIVGEEGIFNYVKRVRFSPNQKYILAEDQAMGVFVWDFQTGKQVISIPNAGDSYQYSQFSPNSKYLLIEGYGVAIWDLDTRKELHKFESSTYGVFSPDNKQLITGNFEGAILWNTANFSKVHAFPEEALWKFSDDSHFLLAIGSKVSIWSVGTGKLLVSFDKYTSSPSTRFYRVRIIR